MGEAAFEGIRKSIMRRQNTVAQYIATRLILYLCELSAWGMLERVSWRWWEQVRMDLEVAKKSAAEVDMDLESDSDLGREESSGVERSGVERGGAGWSGVEWIRRVNAPRMTTGRN